MDGGLDGARKIDTPRQRFRTNCEDVEPRLVDIIPDAKKWLYWLDNFYATRLYLAKQRYEDANRAIAEIDQRSVRKGMKSLFDKSPLPLSESDTTNRARFEEQKLKAADVMNKVSSHWDILTTKVNKLAQINDDATKTLIAEQLFDEIADLIVANNRPRGEDWSRPFDDILKNKPGMVNQTGHSGYLGMYNLKSGIEEPLALLLQKNNFRLLRNHPLMSTNKTGYTQDQLETILRVIKDFPGNTSPVPEDTWRSMDN